MVAATPLAFAQEIQEEDQHVVLWDVSWEDYETILAIRGEDASVPRIFYLDGVLELMSPTSAHEYRKKTLARLLETWAVETRLQIEGYGSWTLKQKRKKAGGEPDECYIVGRSPGENAAPPPDLVIEIEWSRTVALEKAEIYRRLGVRELWTLKKDGSLLVRVREADAWIERKKSKLLPSLDVAWLLGFVSIPNQTDAVFALLDALRAHPRPHPTRSKQRRTPRRTG